ncbi:16313_t:CDS:10 [Acaulospora colombiana]|uniref:16313_t:CDS:1 n=1 Tax=Acaulospora colombiana TaxID=27376 RepID=A0ACA9KZL2_9GLOM|nr:16313_t:CDS:10 [Acaulospora colombiana]
MSEAFLHPKIYNIAERRNYTPNFTATDYDINFLHRGTPLVIDNGSYQCRVGWATESSPTLQFDNLVSKYRDRKLNQSMLIIGNDIYTDATAKTNAKSAFDGNVVYNFETMEYTLDYIFVKLGINTETIDHPILMTEPICNPSHSRKLCYGIDALFSYHANGLSLDGGVIISSGHTTTHVIPVVGGRGVLEQTKRISYGGLTSTDYMLKLMQLKYPTFPTKMTVNQAQYLVHNYTYVAADYFSELKEYSNPKSFAERDRIIQFPYVPPANEKTEEELARAEERKQEQARRLKEQAARLREKKLKDLEDNLAAYMELKSSKSSLKKSEFVARLKENRISDEAELDDLIQKTEKAVQRARNKLLGIDEVEIKEEPTFPLVDIPDDQLNDAEKKEKKKQISAKSLHESRQRQREAKELIRRQHEAEERMEEQKRQADFEGWLNELKRNYQAQLDKVKSLKRKKEQLSDRRSHASQLRMKSIANLASDTPQQKRRRRGQDEDTFGMDDNDWSIYKEISKEEDAWEEEEELSQLKEYETKLLRYDPTFLPEHTFDAKNSIKNSLVFMFTHGIAPQYDPEDFAQIHQLHVNIERIRVPEALFQPSILGLDQAGIVETFGDIISRFDEEQRKNMSVFVTGGHTRTPGLLNRMNISLRSILPAGSPLKIIHAKDPTLDAWRGAAMWARTNDFKNYVVTSEMYRECGGEYLKEHRFGNVYKI